MIFYKLMPKKPSMTLNGTFYYVKHFYIKKFIFLIYMGVRNKSYIGSVFGRLFDYYCKHSTSLYSEYKSFYKQEFKTFEKYLESKHNLMDEEIAIYCDKNSHYKIYLTKPNWKFESLLYNDEIKEKFLKFFGGIEGMADED